MYKENYIFENPLDIQHWTNVKFVGQELKMMQRNNFIPVIKAASMEV